MPKVYMDRMEFLFRLAAVLLVKLTIILIIIVICFGLPGLPGLPSFSTIIGYTQEMSNI